MINLTPGDRIVRRVDKRWGQLGPVLPTATVDAAFVGRDGKTYLFSGDRYVRYSGADYSYVEPGYPRMIARDWGGMDRVDAAFVLDDVTYLFGTAGLLFRVAVPDESDWPAYEADLDAGEVPAEVRERLLGQGLQLAADARVEGRSPQWTVPLDQGRSVEVRREPGWLTVRNAADGNGQFWVRYSGRSYTEPDAGYPRPLTDDWWNLPDPPADVEGHLSSIDAVFTGQGRPDLPLRRRPVRRLRQPAPLVVAAEPAVPGLGQPPLRPGRRRVPRHRRQDLRLRRRQVRPVLRRRLQPRGRPLPQARHRLLGQRRQHHHPLGRRRRRTGPALARGGERRERRGRRRGDAHLPVLRQASTSGTTARDATVEDGYPRSIATSLRAEPRFANLTVPLDGGIDAAVADQRNVYLFTGSRCHVVSSSLYRSYDHLGLSGTTCAFLEDGAVLVESDEAVVPVLRARGRRRSRRHRRGRGRCGRSRRPSAPAWTPSSTASTATPTCSRAAAATTSGWAGSSRPRRIGAARATRRRRQRRGRRVRRPGREDLRVQRRPVRHVHRVHLLRTPRSRAPRGSISEHWGGLTEVDPRLRAGRHHLPLRAAGRRREPSVRRLLGPRLRTARPRLSAAGRPRRSGASPRSTGRDGFDLRAVLFDRDNVFYLSGSQYAAAQRRPARGPTPGPLARLWPGLPLGTASQPLRTRVHRRRRRDVLLLPRRSSPATRTARSPRPTPIAQRWGRPQHRHVRRPGDRRRRGLRLAAATTYLFSGDQYVRYSGSDYRYVDPGYPEVGRGDLRAEECFAQPARGVRADAGRPDRGGRADA